MRKDKGASVPDRACALRVEPQASQAQPLVPSATHTPGPWHVELLEDESGQHIYNDDFGNFEWAVCHPQTVCDVTTIASGLPEFDARLIAAAPCLLAALEHILAGALSLPRFAEEEARAAITKARGDA